MANPALLIEAPQRQARPFGILSLGAPLSMNRLAPLEYQAVCGHAVGFASDLCEDPEVDPEKPGTGELTDVTAANVIVYSRLECNPVGGGIEKAKNSAVEAINAGESAALERSLATLLEADASTVDLGTAATAKEALAVAEQWAIRNYTGRPVLHVPPAVAVLLGDVDRHGTHLEVKQTGTPVSVGDYAPVTWTAGDPATIYVTGQVVLSRGVAETYETLTTTENTAMAMAERAYALGWDCAAAKVAVAEVAPPPAP